MYGHFCASPIFCQNAFPNSYIAEQFCTGEDQIYPVYLKPTESNIDLTSYSIFVTIQLYTYLKLSNVHNPVHHCLLKILKYSCPFFDILCGITCILSPGS